MTTVQSYAEHYGSKSRNAVINQRCVGICLPPDEAKLEDKFNMKETLCVQSFLQEKSTVQRTNENLQNDHGIHAHGCKLPTTAVHMRL